MVFNGVWSLTVYDLKHIKPYTVMMGFTQLLMIL